MSSLAQEVHVSIAGALADPSAAVDKADRQHFESADYTEIPKFHRRELVEFIGRVFIVWNARFVFIRKSADSQSRRISPWRISMSDVDGAAETILREINNLDDVLIINPTSLYTVNISCDEQPPESDRMLSVTICPRDAQLVAALKDIWPDALVSVRNSWMGLKRR